MSRPANPYLHYVCIVGPLCESNPLDQAALVNAIALLKAKGTKFLTEKRKSRGRYEIFLWRSKKGLVRTT